MTTPPNGWTADDINAATAGHPQGSSASGGAGHPSDVEPDDVDREPTRPRGRPKGSGTRLDQRLIDAICTAIAAGNYLKTAAAINGVPVGTVNKWLALGQRDNSAEIFRVFAAEVQKARAVAEARAVGHITRAASDGQWTAAAWFLERTNPNEWGRKERVEVTGADGAPLVGSADDERILQMAATLAARARGAVELDAIQEAVEGSVVEDQG